MSEHPSISPNSQRIARNAGALYVRMFILMIVSLLTARIVLNALGAEDRGVYETVASFVSMMALLSNALSTAISRFLTVQIGKGDTDSLKQVFATAKGLLWVIALLIVLVAEPLGIWYIDQVMNLPDGRTAAAQWVFQFSLLTFVVNLLSIPYNASIFAHERMKIYAIIGVVEGLLKFGVALSIMHASTDRLIFYGGLLLGVAFFVRSLYVLYCRQQFQESRVKSQLYKEHLGAMVSFAGWNGLAQSIAILNAQGVTQLLNVFFGVVFNTMRGLALNVENMIKQFISNVLTAINPQITKSYASGDRTYSAQLACKGSKYAFLIGFTLALPFFFEAQPLLELWLGKRFIPEGTDLFTKLGLVCMVLDIALNPISRYGQAAGRIKAFYLMYSVVTVLVFPITWILFKSGYPATTLYFVFLADYLLLDILKVAVGSRVYGFPAGLFVKETLLRVLPVMLLSLAVTYGIYLAIPEGIWQLIGVLTGGTLCVGLSAFAFALTPGERAYVLSRFHKCHES